ncbi:hypothetical protein Tco_1411150 [Tanacetum coccineum]
MALYLFHLYEDPATMILLLKTAAGFAVGLMQTFRNTSTIGVAKRLSQTLREKSTGLRAEASKMLWSDSARMAYLIYCIPYVSIRFHFLEEEWRGKETSLTLLKLNKANTKESVVLVDIPENLAENDSIVLEHGLSSEITKSLGGSSDLSEGSENSGSFEDGERSEHSPRREAPRLHRLPARKKASQSLWMFRVKEEHDGRKSPRGVCLGGAEEVQSIIHSKANIRIRETSRMTSDADSEYTST